jgi:hypothetical protein
MMTSLKAILLCAKKAPLVMLVIFAMTKVCGEYYYRLLVNATAFSGVPSHFETTVGNERFSESQFSNKTNRMVWFMRNSDQTVQGLKRVEYKSDVYVEPSKVVFIKLQKIGGSTLQSILYRYANEHRLAAANPEGNVSEKVNIVAHHITLQKYLQTGMVDNPVFLTLMRNPLDHACSSFYWNWSGKHFRREQPGNFSAEHLLYLSMYSVQNGTKVYDRKLQKELNLKYVGQWEWFSSSSPLEALDSLIRLKFSVGFMEVRRAARCDLSRV